MTCQHAPRSAGPAELPSASLHDAVQLALVAGVGPRLHKALRDRFGTATAVLDAPPSDLSDGRGDRAQAGRADRRWLAARSTPGRSSPSAASTRSTC